MILVRRQTLANEMPQDWKVVNFVRATNKINGGYSKLQKHLYHNRGQYPVVDQSIHLIGGYTDDSTLLYNGNLPVIVFGDHTLIVKYIDFPFVVGADGTKLISANTSSLVPKFLYYAILAKNLK